MKIFLMSNWGLSVKFNVAVVKKRLHFRLIPLLVVFWTVFSFAEEPSYQTMYLFEGMEPTNRSSSVGGKILENNLSSAQKVIDRVDYEYRDLIGISDLAKGYSQEDESNPLNPENFLTNGFNRKRKIHLNYFASVEKVRTKFWADGSYGRGDYLCRFDDCKGRLELEWAAGATFNLAGLRLTGYYSERQEFDFNSFRRESGMLRSDIFRTYYPRDGYRFTGSYTINEATSFGFSYGSGDLGTTTDVAGKVLRNNFERSLWTVGVYHDVSSWLRIVAEYNRTQMDLERNSGHGADSISVGGILSW